MSQFIAKSFVFLLLLVLWPTQWMTHPSICLSTYHVGVEKVLSAISRIAWIQTWWRAAEAWRRSTERTRQGLDRNNVDKNQIPPKCSWGNEKCFVFVYFTLDTWECHIWYPWIIFNAKRLPGSALYIEDWIITIYSLIYIYRQHCSKSEKVYVDLIRTDKH